MTVRYVLLCRDETPDSDDLRRMANTPGVKILDRSFPQVVVVEASQEAAAKLRSDLKKWRVAKEVTYSSPRLPFRKTRPEKKRGKGQI